MYLYRKMFSLLLVGWSVTVFGQKKNQYDVIVYGATSAGVTASVQASKSGKKVLLISQTKYIGGVTSSGLGATDINNHFAVGGLSREFYQRIFQYYQKKGGWREETRDNYKKRLGKQFYGAWNDSLKMQWMFEPHIAAAVFKDMLKEAKVNVVYNERLNLANACQKKDGKILAVNMESGKVFRGDMFIDCTYEGDLMAKAGVSYTIGREANSKYKEEFNGIRTGKVVGVGEKSIDPYLKEGDPSSGPLPFINGHVAGPEGEADHRLQAYCYRFTLTTDPKNRLPITKPANYNPLWFETTGRMFRLNPKLTLDHVLTLTPLPNWKTDTNHADFIGANYEWPEGSYQKRKDLEQMHRDFVLGLLWFLVSDSRIPEKVKEEMKTYGLPKDEFLDNGNFPTDLYVREARRMVSDYVMTEHNYYRREFAQDGVGLGTYWLDSHVVSRFIDNEGKMRIDGSFWENKQSLYAISYRSIRPKKEECTNLLVPVCLSSSHAAYGSIRMEPVYMILGQSAGLAASLAIDHKTSVQDLNYTMLKDELHKNGQLLFPKDVGKK